MLFFGVTQFLCVILRLFGFVRLDAGNPPDRSARREARKYLRRRQEGGHEKGTAATRGEGGGGAGGGGGGGGGVGARAYERLVKTF